MIFEISYEHNNIFYELGNSKYLIILINFSFEKVLLIHLLY